MVGVVLEGGGARGSYQVGALKALYKCGIYPDAFVGTSIGSVNAAMCAQGDHKKLERIWNSISCEELFNVDSNLVRAYNEKNINPKVLKQGFKTISDIIKNSGIDTTNLKKLYKQYIDEDTLRNSKSLFGLVTYSYTDKKPIEIFLRDIPKGKVYEYLLASCYLPVFKQEKIIDDKIYLDGGFHDNMPINMLLREGYDEIYAIRTYSIGVTKDLIPNKAKITYIGPKKKLGSMILFDKEKIKENAEMGFYDTLKVIKKLDGIDYYFKPKNDLYFELITSNIDNFEYYMLLSRATSRKKVVIKILESILKEYEIYPYKLYDLNHIIYKVKRIMKYNKDHKYYEFIKNLKISLLF